MSVKGSGPISIGGGGTGGQDIVEEFGGSGSHSLSEYRRGAGYVPNGPGANNNIPTNHSNIRMSQFYGATNRIPISITLTQQQNVNLWDHRGGSYIAGISDISVTIPGGHAIGASNTGTYALNISNFSGGDVINIYNYGYIVGCGGAGGDSAYHGYAAAGGQSGGPAMYVYTGATVNFWNYGIIGGGGGGGGGGGCVTQTNIAYQLGGGGGGSGAGWSTNTQGWHIYWVGWNHWGSGGGQGSLTGGGGGGSGGALDVYSPPDKYGVQSYLGTTYGGNGGSGGGLGQAGGSGGSWSGYGNAQQYYPWNWSIGGAGGGSPGYAIIGNNRISWQVWGDVRGSTGNT
jgi:hypothetical protein